MWTEEEMATKMNKIHNMDCLEFMKQVPDNYFDLVLTDPPYGINVNKQGWHNYDNMFGGKGGGKKEKRKYEEKNWDKEIPTKDIFNEILRVSRKTIIFGGNYFINYLHNTKCMIVWDKDNGGNDFADSELAWTNFDTAVRNYKFRWNGMLQQDMANKEERHHPTQKPVELFKMILQDYAVKNNYTKIFDAFGGSGTTGIACKSLGLDWCMTELEPDYCDIANKRLGKVQTSMFAFMDEVTA